MNLNPGLRTIFIDACCNNKWATYGIFSRKQRACIGIIGWACFSSCSKGEIRHLWCVQDKIILRMEFTERMAC
jgi:hypothetical protein